MTATLRTVPFLEPETPHMLPRGRLKRFEGKSLRLEREGDTLVIDRRDMRVTYDAATARLIGTIRADRFSLDALLKIWAATCLPERNRFFLHGAGLRVGGAGVLFLGHSGSGKSTLARLTPGDGVYSNEWACLVCDQEPKLVGSPFWGWDTPLPLSHDTPPETLRAIAVLSPADHTALEWLTPAQGLTAVIDHVPLFGLLEDVAAHTFERMCDLVESVPVGKLSLRKGDLPWDLLLEGS